MLEQTTKHANHLRLVAGPPDGVPSDGMVLDEAAGWRDASAVRSGAIRVVIADCHALVRAGYRALFAGEERIEVVGDAATGQQAVMLASQVHPDVVLLDLESLGVHALHTIEGIVNQPAAAAVMLIVLCEGDERAIAALRAGAVGILEKNARSAELIRGVNALARGEGMLSVDVVRRLLGERPLTSRHTGPIPAGFAELTNREREIVALVAWGLSNGEIAERLVISPATAKTHVSRAMMKVGARHRAELVVLAYETGLVLPRSRTSGPDHGRTAVASG